MVRIQVELSAEQHEKLSDLARATGRPVGELIGNSVDLVLRREARRRALEVIGQFDSGRGDLAQRHDDYLWEDFGP